jgi:lysophospholipase L1-like esterase
MRVSLVDYEKNLRQMISLARAHKVRPVFVNLPIEDADDHSAAHRLVMSKVAQSEGIPFIDANAAFHALSRDKREGFFFDGVHYTVYGNRAVAEMLASRIMPMLGSTRSQRGVRFESAAGRGN